MTTTATVPDVGTTMPDAILVDPADAGTTLREATAGSRSVVFFMRAASCAICRGHVASLVRLAEGGQLSDAKVVIVVPGKAKDASAVAERVPTSVGVVLASGDAHAAAGLGTFLAIQHSGTFVLDADATVLARRTATIPTGSFDAAEVVAALAG